jgi:hypothetical protein
MPCAKGMRGCRPDCLHRRLVRDYQDARDARERLRESATPAPTTVPGTSGGRSSMAQLEPADFARYVPPVLFKDWLIAHAKPREE